MQPAIFHQGKVVCGLTHGHAASCLTEAEKDKALSGWYDEARQKFVYENRFFYMKEIVLIRHAHAVDDRLTTKGIDQIRASLKSLDSFYKSGIRVFAAPSERCEHTAGLIATHLSIPAQIEDDLGEPVTDDKVVAALDSLPASAFVVTHSDFIRKAVSMIGGTFMGYVPNLCLLKLCGNHLSDVAVFYEEDLS